MSKETARLRRTRQETLTVSRTDRHRRTSPACVLMTAQLRRIVLSTASAVVLACVIGRTGPAAQAPRPTGGPIAIVGARLIDGTGTAPVEDSVVVVQGDRIRAVGPRATVQVPRDAEVVEAKGKVLTPGLVDVHCHINQPPEDMKRYWIAQLHWGVTTMRSAGNEKPETGPVVPEARGGTLGGPPAA